MSEAKDTKTDKASKDSIQSSVDTKCIDETTALKNIEPSPQASHTPFESLTCKDAAHEKPADPIFNWIVVIRFNINNVRGPKKDVEIVYKTCTHTQMDAYIAEIDQSWGMVVVTATSLADRKDGDVMGTFTAHFMNGQCTNECCNDAHGGNDDNSGEGHAS